MLFYFLGSKTVALQENKYISGIALNHVLHIYGGGCLNARIVIFLFLYSLEKKNLKKKLFFKYRCGQSILSFIPKFGLVSDTEIPIHSLLVVLGVGGKQSGETWMDHAFTSCQLGLDRCKCRWGYIWSLVWSNVPFSQPIVILITIDLKNKFNCLIGSNNFVSVLTLFSKSREIDSNLFSSLYDYFNIAFSSCHMKFLKYNEELVFLYSHLLTFLIATESYRSPIKWPEYVHVWLWFFLCIERRYSSFMQGVATLMEKLNNLINVTI